MIFKMMQKYLCLAENLLHNIIDFPNKKIIK